jgi:hypothetical protein
MLTFSLYCAVSLASEEKDANVSRSGTLSCQELQDCCLLVCKFFYPEDGGSRFLQCLCKLRWKLLMPRSCGVLIARRHGVTAHKMAAFIFSPARPSYFAICEFSQNAAIHKEDMLHWALPLNFEWSSICHVIVGRNYIFIWDFRFWQQWLWRSVYIGCDAA